MRCCLGVAVGMPPGGSKRRFTPVGLVTCGILVLLALSKRPVRSPEGVAGNTSKGSSGCMLLGNSTQRRRDTEDGGSLVTRPQTQRRAEPQRTATSTQASPFLSLPEYSTVWWRSGLCKKKLAGTIPIMARFSTKEVLATPLFPDRHRNECDLRMVLNLALIYSILL